MSEVEKGKGKKTQWRAASCVFPVQAPPCHGFKLTRAAQGRVVSAAEMRVHAGSRSAGGPSLQVSRGLSKEKGGWGGVEQVSGADRALAGVVAVVDSSLSELCFSAFIMHPILSFWNSPGHIRENK